MYGNRTVLEVQRAQLATDLPACLGKPKVVAVPVEFVVDSRARPPTHTLFVKSFSIGGSSAIDPVP